MDASKEIEYLLQRPPSEIREEFSSPTELLNRLHTEQAENLPEDFLQTAIARDPSDSIVIRGAEQEFSKRTWKEELELRDADFSREPFQDVPDGELSVDELEEIIDQEHRSILSHDFDTCTECTGESEWQCEDCHGDSTVDCNECSGSGSRSCPECSDGMVECQTCRGTGSRGCDLCEGEGTIVVDEDCPNCEEGMIRVKETCSQCQGDGTLREDGETIACPRCSGGWFSSSGIVAVENSCPECQGRGSTRHRQTCPECDGNETIKCGDCGGSGESTCSRCEGDGELTCTVCDGAGENPCDSCLEGRVTCSVCEGDGQTHNIVVRITYLRTEESAIEIGELPHGIEEPHWEEVDPHFVKFEEKAGTTALVRPSEVEMERIEDELVRYDVRFTAVRELTYDYGERNFTIRETDGEIFYSRYPEPEQDGLFDRVRNLF